VSANAVAREGKTPTARLERLAADAKAHRDARAQAQKKARGRGGPKPAYHCPRCDRALQWDAQSCTASCSEVGAESRQDLDAFWI
jgi:hypothetical protein